MTSLIVSPYTHIDIQRVNELRDAYIKLVLDTTIITPQIYNENIEWSFPNRYLKPRVKDIWDARGLLLWGVFTGTQNPQWCKFMNENLINTIFRSVNVFFENLKNHPYINYDPYDRDNDTLVYLKDFFRYVINSFFDRCINDHQSFLCFSAANPIIINTPGNRGYLSPMEFNDLLAGVELKYYRMIVSTFNSRIDVDGNFSLGRNIHLKYRWNELGINLWKELINLPIHVEHNWCKLMNDILIYQIIDTINAVLCVFRLVFRGNHSMDDFINRRISQHIERTCETFFKVDAVVDNPTYSLNKNQWSGEYGMKTLFRENFDRIDQAQYEVIYPPPDDEHHYVRNFMPYPSIPIDLSQRRLQSAALLSSKMHLNDPSRVTLFQHELDDHAMDIILRNLTLKE